MEEFGRTPHQNITENRRFFLVACCAATQHDRVPSLEHAENLGGMWHGTVSRALLPTYHMCAELIRRIPSSFLLSQAFRFDGAFLTSLTLQLTTVRLFEV